MPVAEVLIVGGGVVGLACGRALARRGVAVQLLDPGPLPGAATAASAGMLAAQIEEWPDPRLAALSVQAREVAQRTARDLAQATGIDIGLVAAGIAQLAFSEAEERALKTAVGRQRQLGFQADWLETDQVRERWPVISPAVLGAALAPEDAALDPRPLASAMARDAERAGMRRLVERALELEIVGSRALGVRTAQGPRHADAVVLAAGAWTPGIRHLPRPVPVKPIRGQMIALPWPQGAPPAVLYGGGGYVLRRGGEALVGSTMEAAGFDVSVTPDGTARLREVARTLMPVLGESSVLRQWAGLRPVTPDHLPLLGRDPEVEGLWYATGHGRNGILLAPLSGELIADLVVTGRTAVDLTPWRPERFQKAS